MRIGIDLGGSKIEGIALDATGVELARIRTETPKNDYLATLDALRDVIASLEADVGQSGTVGVGTPGAIDPATGLMKNANSVALNGMQLDRDLARTLDREVRLANDADCFALSEATDGAGAGAAVVFGVILGTGVGGGVVVRGDLVQGPNAIAGEWGHNPLPWPLPWPLPSPLPWPLGRGEVEGPDCYCGLRGCIESYLSGPALEREYEAVTGVKVTASEIAERATAGEDDAAKVLDQYVDRLARSLATVLNVLDPDVVVLGGGVSNVARLYRDVPDSWDRYVFSPQVTTRLVQAQHGDSSGVRGAAWLWPGAT